MQFRLDLDNQNPTQVSEISILEQNQHDHFMLSYHFQHFCPPCPRTEGQLGTYMPMRMPKSMQVFQIHDDRDHDHYHHHHHHHHRHQYIIIIIIIIIIISTSSSVHHHQYIIISTSSSVHHHHHHQYIIISTSS